MSKTLVILACAACIVVIVAGTAVFVRQVQGPSQHTVTFDMKTPFSEPSAEQKAKREAEFLDTLTKEDRERFQRARQAMATRGIWIGGDDLQFLMRTGMVVFIGEFTDAAARTDLPEDQFAKRLKLSPEEKLKLATDYSIAELARLRELADKVSSDSATPAELEEAGKHAALRHIIAAAAK